MNVCEALVNHGANPCHTDNRNFTPVQAAHRAKKTEVVDFLVSKGASPPVKRVEKKPPQKVVKSKLDKKQFVLTKKKDGVWIRLTEEEIAEAIKQLEAEVPQVAAVLKDPSQVS